MQNTNIKNTIHLFNDDAINCYAQWEVPVIIISDGPYGVNGYKGDLKSPLGIGEWYEPHIIEWSKKATPQTTLWFWNTEIGWAKVHPFLEKYGWEYKTCNIWNKGMSHVAGNTNTKTLSHLPIVSEVCVQYIRKAEFDYKGKKLSMKDWLRMEWERTGLPFNKTNEACGVANAATRKYFTKCHLWYMPPSEMFEKIVSYANKYGKIEGKPYFSIDGKHPLSKEEWENQKPKFNCPFGMTNIWNKNQLRGDERVKKGTKAIHGNQKPLTLIQKIIEMSSDLHDVIWDPFGGLFTSAAACLESDRICYSSEIILQIYSEGVRRVSNLSQNQSLQFDT